MILELIQDAAQAVPQDAGQSTAYDSLWAGQPAPTHSAFETVFLAHDKIYVVLVVVLLIWAGITFYLYRTDRRISLLERSVAEDIHGSGKPDGR